MENGVIQDGHLLVGFLLVVINGCVAAALLPQ